MTTKEPLSRVFDVPIGVSTEALRADQLDQLATEKLRAYEKLCQDPNNSPNTLLFGIAEVGLSMVAIVDNEYAKDRYKPTGLDAPIAESDAWRLAPVPWIAFSRTFIESYIADKKVTLSPLRRSQLFIDHPDVEKSLEALVFGSILVNGERVDLLPEDLAGGVLDGSITINPLLLGRATSS